jgi:hypothetical protein
MNKIIERDHRFVKERVLARMGSSSGYSASLRNVYKGQRYRSAGSHPFALYWRHNGLEG